MKIKLLFIVLLYNVLCNAQAPEIEWQKVLGGSSVEQAQSILQTQDGGYLVAGYTQSNNNHVTNNHGLSDIWLVKLNSSGALQWQKTYGGTNFEEMAAMLATPDGGYILVGHTQSNNGDVTAVAQGFYDVWIVKLDNQGNIEWNKLYGGTSHDLSANIIMTADGGYAVLGATYSSNGNIALNHGASDIWLFKLDSLGDIQWSNTFGGSADDGARCILQTVDGGYMIGGTTDSDDGDISINHGSRDCWLLKVSAVGLLEWENTYGGTSSEGISSFLKTIDEGIIIAASTNSSDGDLSGMGNRTQSDGWIFRVNASGTIEWQNTYGDNADKRDGLGEIKNTVDGGYVLLGHTHTETVPDYHGGGDIWVFKINDAGVMQWQHAFGGANGYEVGSKIIQTTDGGFAITGSSGASSGDVIGFFGVYDFWVFKLLPDNLNTHSFATNEYKISPNPTNRIFEVQTSSPIEKIIINDLTGKKVLTQNSDATLINVENLQNGIYIMQIFSEGKITHQKFIKQ